ncbi:MAG: hypothetical protein L0227_08435 [Chloroflexi bacterium]|nr:hypothetical protein [Chloroflexota bacterium]
MSSVIRPAHRSRPAASVLGALLLATVAAGCAFLPGGPTSSPAASPVASPAPSQSAAPPGPLVSVETRGGMCLGGTCGAIVILDTDGTVRTAAKPPAKLGTVSAEDLAGLTAVIAATDFAAIRAKPFTGTCPVAYDGQEVVYEFTTSDGIERIESCVTEVDPRHPLFAGVTAVLGEFISLPLE